MGAGRKTETYTLPADQFLGPYTLSARNLSKEKLAAVIFGCTHTTIDECLSKLLFGLPAPHFVYVRNVTPGLPLFLFNYSDRKLYGIFEATTHGQMNIDPYAWTADGSVRTQFPAQVRVCVRLQCRPLPENQFKPILDENYFNAQHFWFELDRVQTRKLLSLLTPMAISRGKPTPQYTMMRKADHRGLPSCSTVQKAALPKPSTSEAENPTPVPNWDADFPALPSQNTQKAETLRPPTSGAENLTYVTSMNWEAEFPSLPSCKAMQKKAVSCKAPTSATSLPQNRVELGTDLPPLPSSSTIEEPESDYQLTSEVEHLNHSSLNGNTTSATVQNTVKWEADFPDFPSRSPIQEPEWLDSLISDAEHLNSPSLKSDAVPLFGTYSSFQALSDVKKAEQEEFQLIYTKLKKLNLQRNLHSECRNTPLAGNVADSWVESPYSQTDQMSGESSCYVSAQSPGSMFYPWVIAKLLQEVEELQAFKTAQTEKMSYLEDQLVRAQLQIRQLKDFISDEA